MVITFNRKQWRRWYDGFTAIPARIMRSSIWPNLTLFDWWSAGHFCTAPWNGNTRPGTLARTSVINKKKSATCVMTTTRQKRKKKKRQACVSIISAHVYFETTVFSLSIYLSFLKRVSRKTRVVYSHAFDRIWLQALLEHTTSSLPRGTPLYL